MIAQAQLLDTEAINEIRDFVTTQCDIVKNTVGRLKQEKHEQITHRYIDLLIYNIVEFVVMMLSEESANNMMIKINDSLQAMRSQQTSNFHFSNIFDNYNRLPQNKPPYSLQAQPRSTSLFIQGAAPETGEAAMLTEVQQQILK